MPHKNFVRQDFYADFNNFISFTCKPWGDYVVTYFENNEPVGALVCDTNFAKANAVWEWLRRHPDPDLWELAVRAH
jgi:hypothetical protein